jgi:hypothetical protein
MLIAPISRRLKLGDELGVALGALGLGEPVLDAPVESGLVSAGRWVRALGSLLRVAHGTRRLREAMLIAPISRRLKLGDELGVALGALGLGEPVASAPVFVRAWLDALVGVRLFG